MLHDAGRYVVGRFRDVARNMTPRNTAMIMSTQAYVTMNSSADCCRFDAPLPINIESFIAWVGSNINIVLAFIKRLQKGNGPILEECHMGMNSNARMHRV